MFEDWEDFDSSKFIPLINKDEQKSLEERKLVEEADNKLTNDLFISENDQMHVPIQIQIQMPIPIKPAETPNDIMYKISKKQENEDNLKELSKKQKQRKMQQQRLIELYGEAEPESSKYDYYDYEEKIIS
jgi:hypothetical protein